LDTHTPQIWQTFGLKVICELCETAQTNQCIVFKYFHATLIQDIFTMCAYRDSRHFSSFQRWPPGVRRRMMFIPWRAEWKTLKKRVAFGSPYCLIAIAIAIAIAIVCVCVCVCQCACVCVWACNLCKQSLVSSLYAASWSAFPSSWGCPCAIIPDGKLWFSILSLFSSVF